MKQKTVQVFSIILALVMAIGITAAFSAVKTAAAPDTGDGYILIDSLRDKLKVFHLDGSMDLIPDNNTVYCGFPVVANFEDVVDAKGMPDSVMETFLSDPGKLHAHWQVYNEDKDPPIWGTLTDNVTFADEAELSRFVPDIHMAGSYFRFLLINNEDHKQYVSDPIYIKNNTSSYDIGVFVESEAGGKAGFEGGEMGYSGVHQKYPLGTPVTLVAKPDKGYTFEKWRLYDLEHKYGIDIGTSSDTKLDIVLDTVGNKSYYAVFNKINVKAAGMKLDKSKAEVGLKKTLKLNPVFIPSDTTNKKVKWKSSDPKIATVDANGVVTGVALGECEITATSIDGGFTAKCKVTTRFNDVMTGDVSAGPFKSIYWAVDKGIIVGYKEDGTFRPHNECTREQFVVMLWRMAGRPIVPEPKKAFTDVDKKASSYKAIKWAVSKGFILGYENGLFKPADPLTRKQIVVIIWRMLGRPTATKTAPFKDVKSSDSAYRAIQWAFEKDLIKGYDKKTFGPGNNCTRSQIVTILYRAVDKGFLTVPRQ